jgi:hypothetical protein
MFMIESRGVIYEKVSIVRQANISDIEESTGWHPGH